MDNLIAETPAIGILKTHDFGDSMHYTVFCQCQNPDDMIKFDLELEVDAWNIVLNTYFTPKSEYWKRLVNDTGNFDNSWLWSIDSAIRSLINGLHHRIMVSWDVWTKGYVQYHQSTIMSEQQALNYAATINQSIEDLRTFRENQKSKREEKYSSEEQGGC
jgi:hypothetical protein